MISILILTRNEEHDLPGCLASVAWSDDVHVFDSCSTDRTQAIAREAGVHLHERRFDNYAAQRNTALNGIDFKYDWLFLLDCDERLNPELYEEMKNAIANAPPEVDAFRIRRNDYFLGSCLRYCQIMPWYTRLVRRGRGRYGREINEVLEVDGQIGELSTRFDHYSFSKGLARWFEKHNLYSSMEAKIVADQSFLGEVSWRAAFTEPDFHKRRRAQKAIFYQMPCRPLLRWAYMMFYRRGILDGYAGFTYATLQAFYEYSIVLKTREILSDRRSAQNRLVFAPAAEDGTLAETAQLPRFCMRSSAAPMISVLILTRNEEQDLPGCLDSVAWCDDVWVFDSYSDDATAALAQSRGAHLVQRRFDNYAAQRNAALETLAFRHDWIFLLDADERLSPGLATEMRQAVGIVPESVAGFRLRRRDHFLGRWLKHAQTTPLYIRLVRRGRARYAREINEVLVLNGEVRDLPGAFDHYPFSKGMTHWIAKHNSYATGEAKIVAEQTFQADASWKTAFFAKDFNAKHSARKAIFYRMPGRPLVRWAYLMFYRRGILDGHAGFVYSTLQAIYEYFIVLKTEELRAGQTQGRRP